MATFDIDNYFDKRVAADLLNTGGSDVGLSKYDELMAASRDKVSALQEARSSFEENRDSLVGQAGFAPNGFAGSVTNLGASLWNGLSSHIAGPLAGLPKAIESAYYNATLDGTDTEAFNRLQQGKATAADKALLSQKEISPGEFLSPEEHAKAVALGARDGGNSKLDLFNKAIAARTTSRNIVDSFDRSSLVHKGNRDGLQADLANGSEFALDETKAGWEDLKQGNVASGAGNMIAGVAQLLVHAGKAAANNKLGVAEYVAENAPQLMMGLFGKAGMAAQAMSNVGYASDYYQQGMENFQAKHNRLPSVEEQNKMALQAASLAAAEQLGDSVGVGAIKGMEGVSKLAAKAAGAAEVDAARLGFKQAMKGIGKATTEGVLSEAPTEGYQTYIEGELTGKPASAQDIYQGATIGGLSGGVMTGGGRAVSQMAGTTPEHMDRRQKSKEDAVQHVAAIQANDTSAYLNTDSTQYNPVKAMEVLLGHAELPTTTEETKTENLSKSKELLKSLEDAANSASVVEMIAKSSVSAVEGYKKTLEQHKAALEVIDPSQTSEIEQKKVAIATLEAGIAASTGKLLQNKASEDAIRKTTELNAARDVQKRLSEMVKPLVKQEAVATDVAVANSTINAQDQTAVVSSQQAVERLINLSMSSANHLSANTATELADNRNNSLTEPQRLYLREFSKARIEENNLQSMSTVHNTVLHGDKFGNLGLTDYQRYIGNAMESGDKKTAMRYMDMLSNFADSHVEKSKFAAQAWKEAVASGRTVQLLREYGVGGKWFINQGKRKDPSERERVGGIDAHPNSDKSKALVDIIPTEAKVITQALSAHVAAYKLKFGEDPKVTIPVLPANVSTNQAKVDTSVKPVQKTEESIQVAPTPVAPELKTWDNMQKGDQVTLYRGESSTNETGGQWWTTDKSYAEKYGTVQEVTLPAEVIGLHAAKGHGGNTQFVFASKKPPELALQSTQSPASKNVSENNPAEGKPRLTEVKAKRVKLTAVQKQIKQVERAIKRAARTNPQSLWSTLKHSLNEANLSEIYGSDWKKKYTLLKSNTASDISTRVASGQLNEFLPHALRFGDNYPSKDEQESVQYIYDRMGAGEYLTHDTYTAIGELQVTLQQLEEALSIEDVQREIEFAEAAIANESASDQKDQSTQAPATAGSVAKHPTPEAAKAGKSETGTRKPSVEQESGYADASPELQAEVDELLKQASEAGIDTKTIQDTAYYSTPNGTKEDVLTKEKDALKAAISGKAGTSNKPVATGTGTQQDGQATVTTSTGDSNQDTGTQGTEQAVVTGKLSLFEQVREKATGTASEVLKATNVVAEYFKQSGLIEGAKSQRALVQIKDFLSAWNKDRSLALANLGVETLTAEQSKALKSFREFANRWLPGITDNFLKITYSEAKTEFKKLKGNIDFKTEDLMQYFYHDDKTKADTDENVKTAIAAAAYSWIVSQANSPARLTKKQVNDMHQQEDEAEIDNNGYKKLQTLTAFKNSTIDSLGKEAYQALGLKERDGSTPIDMKAKIQSALGSHVLALLVREGFIKVIELPASEVNSYWDVETAKPFNEFITYNYVQFIHKEDMSNTDQVHAIKDANHASKDVLGKLFGLEASQRMASTEPAKFTQEKAKGTNQDISKVQSEAIDQTQHEPHSLISDMWTVTLGLGKEAILRIAGFKDISPENPQWHDKNVASIQAQNDNLTNQFDLMKEMLDQDGKEGIWYVLQSVWRNYRAGMTDQSMNLQTSKIHRAMFSRPEWTVNLKFSDEKFIKEFLISIAMGLGTKTDQQRNDTTIGKEFDFDKQSGIWTFKNPKIMEAASILGQGLQEGEHSNAWTVENLAKVEAVASKEGMMSLQALTAYAKYLNAHSEGKDNFDFTLLVGADGKTNGPMLTLLALGAASYETLNRGGMFSIDDKQASHFSEYYEDAKAMDLYQDLGKGSLDNTLAKRTTADRVAWFHKNKKKLKLSNRDTPFTHAQFSAFQVLTKNLSTDGGKVSSAMRNLVKTPLTAFFFGSTLNRAVKGMEDAFIDNIYTAIEEIRQDKRDDATIGQLVEALNTLMEQSNYGLNVNAISKNMTIEKALKFTFEKDQEIALRKSFQILMGNSVKATMETKFSTFITRRDQMNKTIQAAYETYAAAYAQAKFDEITKLMDAGKLPFRISESKKGEQIKVPLHDLTADQEKVLRLQISDLLPIMHTDYSLKEDNIRAGILMAKTIIDKSKSPIYQSKVAYWDGQAQKMLSQAFSNVEVTPGVAGLPYAMHSSDSSNMHKALLKVPQSLNVHDEISNGVTNIAKAAEAINAATVDTFLHYSPAREAANMLERVVIGIAKRIENKTASATTVYAMLEQWVEVFNRNKPDEEKATVFDVAEAMMSQAISTAQAADLGRLTNIANMAVMDQYTWEGGQFNVTKEIRDKAKAMVSKLSLESSKEFQAAIAKINEALEDTSLEPAYPAWMNVQKEEVPAEETPEPFNPTKTSPWGALGKSAVASDPEMLALFNGKSTITAKEVFDKLQAKFPKGFTGKLLEQLRKAVSPDLKIHLISADTTFDADTKVDASRGWYAMRGTADAIYIMGPEFLYSGFTPGMLIHELVHAALARTIGNTRHSQASTAANALFKELDTLRGLAAAYVSKSKDPAIKFYTNILNGEFGVDELISWGMTNRHFQDNVLMKINMDSQTKTNKLVTGMQSFIAAITGFFFRNNPVQQESGMAVLLANVSGLFAEQAAPKTEQTANYSMAAQINTFSTLDIHEALDTGANTPEFNQHLRNVLSSIVEKLHGPSGSFKDAIMKDVPTDAIDVLNEALVTGVAPFTSELQASGFVFNNQTYFAAEQVEASVKALLDSQDGKMSAVREELRKLEAEVRSTLKPQSFYKGDWFQATKDERDEATALYNYLFKKVDGDYLARFAALGLTHEGFNSLLKIPTKQAPVVMQDRSVGNTLTRLFDRILISANGRLTNTQAGQNADQKLAALVRQLVEIENRKKAILKNPTMGIVQFADQKVRATRRGAKNQIDNLINSAMFKKNKNVFISAGGHLVSAVMNNHVKYIFRNMNVMRNSASPGIQGVIAGTLMEVNGASHALQKILREGKAHIEGQRKKIISYTNKNVLEAFEEAGEYLTDEAKSALTAVVLRTGAHILLDHFDMKQLENMITDDKALNKEIAKFEGKLSQFNNSHQEFFIESSRALAYHLVTNKTTNAHLLKNASNIANMYGTAYQGQLTEAQQKEATAIIDSLTSLYAISYSNTLDRIEIGKVLARENKRTDANGVEFAMLTHKQAEEESKDRLFADSDALMMKGYVPEIYNPHTDIKVATLSEGDVLENLGYKKVANLSIDPHEPFREPRALYIMRDGGLRPWLSGIFSFTGMRAKGTKHHGEHAPGTQAVLTRNRQQAINAMFRPSAGRGKNFDPRLVDTNYMAPLLNANGDVVNYQYLMQAATKKLLERDSRFDTVLGALSGSIFDKEKSSVHNRKAVEVLYEDFKKDFSKNSVAFLKVGPNSPDAELREIYRMLPKRTKDDIRAIWGKDEMMVKAENLDIAFGYRKLSLSTIFEKDVMDQGHIDKALIWFVERALKHTGKVFKGMTDAQAEKYSKSSAVMVRRGERIWQELAHEVKDIYVVKNIITSVNNFRSNMITLALYGVGITSGIRDMRIAWVGAEEHQRDSAQLFKLKQQLDTGYVKGDTSEIELEIQRLEQAIKNNPVSEMIDAGLMPTIVEDVGAEEDIYAYKTAFAKKVAKYTDKLNPTVKKVARNAYMTHDSGFYQTLSRITQLSDFVARYALYQHLTTRAIDPVSKELAIQEASDAFVNYDVPMHRDLQYMDDMGLFMFTKYFLRVQRVIRGRFVHAPGKMLMMLAAEQYVGDLPTIVDASMFVRAGNNPVNTGPLQLINALPEIPAIGAAMGMFRM